MAFLFHTKTHLKGNGSETRTCMKYLSWTLFEEERLFLSFQITRFLFLFLLLFTFIYLFLLLPLRKNRKETCSSCHSPNLSGKATDSSLVFVFAFAFLSKSPPLQRGEVFARREVLWQRKKTKFMPSKESHWESHRPPTLEEVRRRLLSPEGPILSLLQQGATQTL